MASDLKDFDLVLLPTRLRPGTEFSTLYASVYETLRAVWIKTLEESGNAHLWSGDYIFRGEILPTVLYKGQVAGCFVTASYPLSEAWTGGHSYFSIFSKEAVEKMHTRGWRDVMTWEYLAIPENMRKGRFDIPLSAVLVGLGVPLAEEYHCDGLVGVARLENKVEQISAAFGSDTLMKDARRGSLRVDIVALDPNKALQHPNERVNELITHLWNNRVVVDRFGQAVRHNLQPALKVA